MSVVARGAINASGYTRGEEIAHSVTHGIGAALSLVGLTLLVTLASIRGDAWRVVSFSIYGTSLVLLYLSSTFYHAFQSPRIKGVFRVFDHSTIFLLIAGSYTPFTLVSIRGSWGWTLFGLVWGIAAVGIVLKSTNVHRFQALSLLVYLVMGWLAIIAVKPLIQHVPPGGITLIVIGGLCYTLGTPFYALKKVRYAHVIWHLFVLGGSILHYFCVLFYVLPMAH